MQLYPTHAKDVSCSAITSSQEGCSTSDVGFTGCLAGSCGDVCGVAGVKSLRIGQKTETGEENHRQSNKDGFNAIRDLAKINYK